MNLVPLTLTPDVIAEWLNKLPMVTWDRFARAPVEDDELLSVYGWIPRDDGRSDFVLLEFPTWSDRPGFTTSSALLSAHMHELLFGTSEGHADCERVEDWLGDRVRAVQL
jgi:hypothetical protein